MQTGRIRFADAFRSADALQQNEMIMAFLTASKKVVRSFEWRYNAVLDDYREYCNTAFAILMDPKKDALPAVTGPASLVAIMRKQTSFLVLDHIKKSSRCVAGCRKLRGEILAGALQADRGDKGAWAPVVHHTLTPEQAIIDRQEREECRRAVGELYTVLRTWLETRRPHFRENVKPILDYVVSHPTTCIRSTPRGFVFNEGAIASGLEISVDQYRGRMKRLKIALRESGFVPLSQMLAPEDARGAAGALEAGEGALDQPPIRVRTS